MRKIAIIVVVCMCACGCVALAGTVKGTSTDGRSQDKGFFLGGDVVGRFIEGYRAFTREKFSAMVASDFVPVKVEFINRVEQSYLTNPVLALDFSVDSAIVQGDTLAVNFTWEKKTQPFTSVEPVLTRGKAEFVFKKHGEQWLLFQVSKDNPL